MSEPPRTVRIGDAMAPVIAWGYVLFLLVLLAMVVAAGGMFINHAIRTASMDSTSVLVLGAFVLVIGLATLPLWRIAGRLHRVVIAADGGWRLFSPLGNRLAALAPQETRCLLVYGFQQMEWHAGGHVPSTRRRLMLRIELTDGRGWVGYSNEPELLTALGYRLAPDEVEQQESGAFLVRPHTWVDGAPCFEAQ